MKLAEKYLNFKEAKEKVRTKMFGGGFSPVGKIWTTPTVSIIAQINERDKAGNVVSWLFHVLEEENLRMNSSPVSIIMKRGEKSVLDRKKAEKLLSDHGIPKKFQKLPSGVGLEF